MHMTHFKDICKRNRINTSTHESQPLSQQEWFWCDFAQLSLWHLFMPSWGVHIGLVLFSKWCEINEWLKIYYQATVISPELINIPCWFHLRWLPFHTNLITLIFCVDIANCDMLMSSTRLFIVTLRIGESCLLSVAISHLIAEIWTPYFMLTITVFEPVDQQSQLLHCVAVFTALLTIKPWE